MKKSVIVGLLVGISMGFMVLIQDAQSDPITLQPSGFTGPTFEWDAYGQPLDPIEEADRAVWTARNHWGIGAVLVTDYDPTATHTDTPGCSWFDMTQPNVSDPLLSYLTDNGWYVTEDYNMWSPECAA